MNTPAPERSDVEQFDEQTKRSVDAIVRLHGVVMALALTVATSTVVSPYLSSAEAPGSAPPLGASLLLQYVTLIVTIIPFYHGANRHMDVAHVFAPAHRIRAAAIMIDFVLLFAEAIEFFVLALALGDPSTFQVILLILIGTDSVWGLISYAIARDAVSKRTIARWMGLNAAFFLYALFINLSVFRSGTQIVALSAGAVIRTAADYAANRRFYFNQPAHADDDE